MTGNARKRSGRDEGIAVRLCARRVAPAESSGYDSGDRVEQTRGELREYLYGLAAVHEPQRSLGEKRGTSY